MPFFSKNKGYRTIIAENESSRDKWDIEENKGYQYTSVPGINVKYKVWSSGRKKIVSSLLFLIDEFIQTIQERLPDINPGCHVFIHTPHTVQECRNENFHGINKPKDIIQLHTVEPLFKKDNQYRATYRHVMLTLRTKNGDLKAWSSLKKLLLHELSHTMCNHITYREEGNHEEDFDEYERFLTNFVNQDPEIKLISDRIENFIRDNK